MKKYILSFPVVLLFAAIFAGCAIERDLTRFIGTWETTTYANNYVHSTNGLVITNYIELVNKTNYTTNYVYTFNPNNVGIKITLTNGADYRTDSITWILDEIGKTFTVYIGSTNERFEYEMGTDTLKITGMQLIYDSTNIDVFEAMSFYLDTGSDQYEYVLQYIECVDLSTTSWTNSFTN